MSAQPAKVIELESRGTLRVGSCADVVVFDAGGGVEFRGAGVAVEVEEYAVRRGGDAGTGACDDLRGRVVYQG